MNRNVFWLLAAVLAGAGCGPRGPDPIDETPRCAPIDGDPSAGTRALEVGEGLPPGFVPYAELPEAFLIVGPQGGTMITPVLRVAASPGDPEEQCWRTFLKNTYDPAIAPESTSDGVTAGYGYALRDGAYFTDGVVWDLLSFGRDSLRGSSLTLDVVVQGVDFEASQTIEVQLQ